jgi:hypothetical protein
MRNKLSTTLVCAAVLSLFCVRAGYAATDAGEVLTFNSDSFLVVGDQRTALKIGDKVHPGDVLDVPGEAKLKLRMADGSILSLASNTHLTIQSYDIDAAGNKRTVRLGLDAGLLHAIVAPAGPGSAFEVDTPLAIAATRSTNWFIEAAADKTKVAVLDGSVSLAARDPKGNAAPGGVVVAANSFSEIDAPAAPPAEPKPGTRPPPPRRIQPTPPRPLAKSEIDPLIDRTSVTFGWCQCIADTTGIRASCEPSPDGCKSTCAGGKYSFVPNARLSCARFYADIPPAPDKQP